MGYVWRAQDTLLQRPVAVKVLGGQFTDDSTFLTRFRYEARHAALLSDPNIAAVHDYGEGTDADGERLAYLVMELVEGEPLSALLRRTGRLDVASTTGIVRQAASALAAAHAAGVVHRDVKPANVLVRSDGVVKLTDFGIAWSAASVPLTRAGQVMGTPHYLAPEQTEGVKATAASDVYSLGVIAYECLAGRRPFEGENSVQTALMHAREVAAPLPADLPEDVRRLVARAMARRPADRFPDGAALRDAVDALAADSRAAGPERHPTMLLAGDAVGTAPPEPDASSATEEVTPGRHRSGSGRSRAAIAAGAALLLALVVAGALLLSPDGSETAAPPVPSPATGTSRGAAPGTVPLAADEFVGRQVDEVQARLTALGLAFRLVPTETTDLPDGQVIALDPVGNLDPGQLVVVTYAAAPAGGLTTAPPTSAAPTSTARPPGAPTSEPTSAPTTSSGSDRPGEGRGNGRGNGRGHDG